MTNREKLIAENPILDGHVDDSTIAFVNGKPRICYDDSIYCETCDFHRPNDNMKSAGDLKCSSRAKEWLDSEVPE